MINFAERKNMEIATVAKKQWQLLMFMLIVALSLSFERVAYAQPDEGDLMAVDLQNISMTTDRINYTAVVKNNGDIALPLIQCEFQVFLWSGSDCEVGTSMFGGGRIVDFPGSATYGDGLMQPGETRSVPFFRSNTESDPHNFPKLQLVVRFSQGANLVDINSDNDKLCIDNPEYVPTPSPTPSPSPTPTASPTATMTPTASATPSPSASPTPSPTQSPTMTPTPSPTATATPSPTASPTPSPTVTPTASASPTPTPSPTASPTPSPTQSPTPTMTASPTQTPTPSPTASPTPTPIVPKELNCVEVLGHSLPAVIHADNPGQELLYSIWIKNYCEFDLEAPDGVGIFVAADYNECEFSLLYPEYEDVVTGEIHEQGNFIFRIPDPGTEEEIEVRIIVQVLRLLAYQPEPQSEHISRSSFLPPGPIDAYLSEPTEFIIKVITPPNSVDSDVWTSYE